MSQDNSSVIVKFKADYSELSTAIANIEKVIANANLTPDLSAIKKDFTSSISAIKKEMQKIHNELNIRPTFDDSEFQKIYSQFSVLKNEFSSIIGKLNSQGLLGNNNDIAMKINSISTSIQDASKDTNNLNGNLQKTARTLQDTMDTSSVDKLKKEISGIKSELEELETASKKVKKIQTKGYTNTDDTSKTKYTKNDFTDGKYADNYYTLYDELEEKYQLAKELQAKLAGLSVDNPD